MVHQLTAVLEALRVTLVCSRQECLLPEKACPEQGLLVVHHDFGGAVLHLGVVSRHPVV